MATLRQVLIEAINEIGREGYTNETKIEEWARRIRAAVEQEIPGDRTIDDETMAALKATFERMVKRGGIIKRAPAVSVGTLKRIEPRLRAELDRRIVASADLIKLRRRETIDRTLQRFRGWSTSIPLGGSGPVDKLAVRESIAKATAQYKFERRRVAIDQGHKMAANISAIAAIQSGAIAAIWRSHWRQVGYDYRPDHKKLDGELFLIRDNWALKNGWIKLAGHRYSDEVEQPAVAVYCQCFFQYINQPLALPREMLTAKGRKALGVKEAA